MLVYVFLHVYLFQNFRDENSLIQTKFLNKYFQVYKQAVGKFSLTRAVARTIIGGGGGGCILIYSCSARRISFEIDCFYGM